MVKEVEKSDDGKWSLVELSSNVQDFLNAEKLMEGLKPKLDKGIKYIEGIVTDEDVHQKLKAFGSALDTITKDFALIGAGVRILKGIYETFQAEKKISSDCACLFDTCTMVAEEYASIQATFKEGNPFLNDIEKALEEAHKLVKTCLKPRGYVSRLLAANSDRAKIKKVDEK